MRNYLAEEKLNTDMLHFLVEAGSELNATINCWKTYNLLKWMTRLRQNHDVLDFVIKWKNIGLNSDAIGEHLLSTKNFTSRNKQQTLHTSITMLRSSTFEYLKCENGKETNQNILANKCLI
ncbi:hypothetical protein KUTeg_015548 [Tegillarca granosa]|uniref:Uncharacterized protein n=1 Tax=Tegillarca granosa TaxID=220873 RepID=A0ABQ9EQF7_TEGGR|nr:hypothetical protein KUTeg_015548 [Tegillarca granosa]